MIENILYCSVRHLPAIKQRKNAIIISINDYYSKVPQPDLNGFAAVLKLCFKDRCEEEYNYSQPWPDRPTDAFCQYILGIENEKLFDRDQADLIKQFVDQYHTVDNTKYQLIVQCRAGVSRSAAIAAFLSHHLGLKLYSERDRFRPNPRVIRLLNKVYNAKYEYEDLGSNWTQIQQLGVS